MTRMARILGLAMAFVIVLGSTSEGQEVCTLPTASCGGAAISVAIDYERCNLGADCAGCMVPGVQLQAQATVNIPAACGGNRTVRICQYWIKLPSTIQASSCSPAMLAPGSATAYQLNSNVSSVGDYEYRIFVNDVTGFPGCNNCADDCDPEVGCGTKCEDQPASDGSCTIEVT